MIAGTLTELIRIMFYQTVTDEFGGTSLQEVEEYHTKANVKYKDGKREVENNEIVNTYQYIFTIRHYHQINERKNFIRYRDHKYRILSIDATEPSKLVITTEVVND